MKSEDEQISDDECLLRRVHSTLFSTAELPISPGAFRPRTKPRDIDTDGISLYREECQSNPADIIRLLPPEKQRQQGIVRIPISFLRSIGLTVVSQHDDQIKGHVVIPELNASAYLNDSGQMVAIMKKLAAEASKPGNIVKRPDLVPGQE